MVYFNIAGDNSSNSHLFKNRNMVEIIIYVAIFLAGLGIGIMAGSLIKADQVIGFWHFNVWEQTNSRNLHITPRAGGKIGIESANENGILIVLTEEK